VSESGMDDKECKLLTPQRLELRPLGRSSRTDCAIAALTIYVLPALTFTYLTFYRSRRRVVWVE
jgi:hypothetical protein